MVIQTRAGSWWAVAAIAVAGSVVLAISSASAQSTYTWANTNVSGTTPPLSLNWFSATQATWTGGTPVSSNLNTIQFFDNSSTALTNTVAATQASVLDNSATAFQLGTLTLSGLASNTNNANLIMNLSGDALNFSAATGTINLNAALNGSRAITYNAANNVQLGTASSASNLTLTGNGTGTFNFTGNFTELQAGTGSKLIKSGSSTATLSGAVTVSGGLEVNGGMFSLTGSSNAITGGITLNNGGTLDYTSASTLNGNNISVNGAATLRTGSNPSTNANIILNPGANLSLATSSGSQSFSSAVTGDGALTITRYGSGSGTYVLNSTANTFTGGITFANQGNTLQLTVNSLADSASVGAGNIAFAGTNGGTSPSYLFILGSGASAPLTLNNRRIEFTSTSTSGGVLANNSSRAFTINTDLLVSSTSTPTLILRGTGSGLSSFNGLIANGTATSVALTKNESGTWVLGNSANSYAGATRILSGTLSIGKLADFNAHSSIGAAASGAIILGDGNNSGTLLYTGGEQSTNRTIQINTTTNTSAGGATITNNGTGTLTFTAATFNQAYTNANVVTRNLALGGSSNGVIEGVIQNNSATNNVSLSKSGNGTWKLSGANTYTGTTTMSGGGTLVLDYSVQDNSKLADAAAFTLGAGAINLVGGSHTEVVASTTITANEGVRISRVSGSAVLQLGAITRNNSSTLSFSADSIATTSTTNTNGILGTWATVGSNWAVNSTNGANGSIVGLSSYTALPTTGGTGTVNYQLTGTQTQTGDVTTNTVRIVNSGNSDTLALGTRALNLGSGTGGLIYAGGFDDIFTISGTGAIKSQTANNQVVLNVFTGTLTVNALLNAGSAVTSKFGAGTLVVGGNNTSSGAFYQQEGVVRLTHSNALGTTAGGVVVQNGAALELANSVAIGAEATTITGTGISNGGAVRNVISNTSSYAGTITLGVGGARINSDSNGALTLAGGVVTNTFRDVTFGGAGNTTVSTTAISGAGNLIKDGSGDLSLAFANTYTGQTDVNAGTLLVSGSGSINTTSAINVAAGARFANNSSVALALAPTLSGNGTGSRAVYGGTGTLNAALTLDNVGDVLSPGNSPGIMSFGVNQSWASNSYDWELNDWAAKVAGTNIDQINITGSLALTGATPGSYILNVLSLTGGDVSGAVPNFSDVNNSWTILTTTGGISGFSADYWTINVAGFTSSPTATGSWSVAQSGNDLVLNYVAVPEPATIVLVASGAAILGSLLARRRRGS